MYEIYAANSVAQYPLVLIRKNGELYKCFASTTAQEKHLKPIEDWEVEIFIEKHDLLVHNPPTRIGKPSDWIAGDRVYRRRQRMSHAA